VKIIERDILPFQEKEFFVPIRDIIQYARVIVFAARQLLLNPKAEDIPITSKMKLIVDKMSRLFFYKDQKYYSVSFPLLVKIEHDEVLEISTYSGKILDSQSISAVISIIESSQFRINPSLIDYYIEPDSIDSSGLFILEEIFQFEPSYLRFDYDPDNENGKFHPVSHLDVNYSQYSTFKIGLDDAITQYYFEDLQNINTECSFIKD